MEIEELEYFPLVDEDANVIGKASRKECHSGTFLLHPVVHLHVMNSSGELYLQKRAMNKDIQPGKWDTSVGGHVDYGESINEALFREIKEELSIEDFTPIKAFSYVFRSTVECELINTFYTLYDGEIVPDPVEIDEGRFWSLKEIEEALDKDIFTPNFAQEFIKIKPFLQKMINQK